MDPCLESRDHAGGVTTLDLVPSDPPDPSRKRDQRVRIRMLPPIDAKTIRTVTGPTLPTPIISTDIVRAIRAIQKNWTPIASAMPSANVLKAVQETIVQRQKLMDGIAETVAGPINAAVKSAFEVQKQMLASISTTQMVFKSLEGVREVMRGFAEQARQWEEDQRELLVLLAPRGWLVSPSLAMQAPREMLDFADEHGVEALEKELISVFDADRLEGILNDCYGRPSFEAWKPTFSMALNAHRRGEYPLAIPIWLLAIDGIVEDELGVQRVYTRIRKKRRNPVRVALADAWPEALLEGLIRVLLEVAAQDPNNAVVSPNPVVARHPILHGKKPEIGDEKDSIQCVLMLEVIHLLVGIQERRANRAA
jgi:hypothetical protein